MKAFIFLCLVAAAMAEADPQYFYGGAHSYSPYTTYSAGLHYNSPYVYSGVHSYSPYSGLYNHYGKREAEAEPKAEAEADPALIYSSPFAYSGAHSYSPYTTYSAGHHYGGLYNGVYNTPYVHGVHAYGKREAEADPQYVYSGVGYPYTTGLSHYNNFAYSGLYNHYTTPYVHSYGKREAEAEAEPWGTYYGGYSGYARPYAYGGYAGYGGYRRGYNGWY